jgi:zinc transporter 5/7
LGFLVNLIGLFFFHDHGDHDHGDHAEGHACEGGDGHSHDHHDHHHNENLQGVFLHVLADCLGSVGVIFSSILVKYYKMYVADPVCSFIISLMILATAVPFIQNTASALILKNPHGFKKKQHKIHKKIEKIDGVLECNNLTIWEMGKKKMISSVQLLVRSNANRSSIHDEVSTVLRSNKIKDICTQMGSNEIVIIEESKPSIADTTNVIALHTEDDLNVTNASSNFTVSLATVGEK